jgi:hypothetical protein
VILRFGRLRTPAPDASIRHKRNPAPEPCCAHRIRTRPRPPSARLSPPPRSAATAADGRADTARGGTARTPGAPAAPAGGEEQPVGSRGDVARAASAARNAACGSLASWASTASSRSSRSASASKKGSRKSGSMVGGGRLQEVDRRCSRKWIDAWILAAGSVAGDGSSTSRSNLVERVGPAGWTARRACVLAEVGTGRGSPATSLGPFAWPRAGGSLTYYGESVMSQRR